MSRIFSIHRFAIALVTIVATLLVADRSVAQSPEGYSASGPFYQPVSLNPVEHGFTQHHASTAAEGFLRGKAAVIQALGSFELSDSQAQILYQQARALSRENDLAQTAALHTQQKMWIEARVQARKDRNARRVEGQQLLAARQATVYRQAYRLSANELDTTTGQICWPAALRTEQHQQERARVEELFRKHVYGAPTMAAANEIARSIESLSRALRSESRSLPRDEYLVSQKFLLGLKYAALALAEAT